MRILHITPHLGGGVGTIIRDWARKLEFKNLYIASLEVPEGMDKKKLYQPTYFFSYNNQVNTLNLLRQISIADIVLVHYWDRRSLNCFLQHRLPSCRLIFWCHKNYPISQKELDYPDLFIDTSPIQGHGRYIWATGNMERFQKIEPVPYEGVNVGFIGHRRKAHPQLEYVLDNTLPCRFIGIGEEWPLGKIENVIPFLSDMDIFAYMLRPDHYGTSEQVLGEALSAGLSVLVMDNPCEMEIISNGYNGYVAESVEDYILKLNMLIEHKEVREWLRPRAKESARRIYNIDNMITEWEGVFEELMKQPKKRRGGLIL